MAFCHLLRYLCQTVAQSSRGGARLQLQTLSRMVQSDPDGNTLLLCVHGLKDATVKLQHAYLNIIAILLHYATCDDTAGPGAAIVNKTLEVWRVLLCDGRTPVLAVICALLEQSSSAVVRAKAVLCIQLLDSSCRAAGSNRVLRSLGDNRRFISAVSRCLEAAEGADGSFSHNASLLASPAGQKEGQSTTQQYLAQCARSFGGHVQRVLLQALERVGGDLGQATEALWVQEGHGPSVLSQHLHRGLLDARKCTEGIMHSFDTVRACVALSSSPQMLRLVLSEETVLKAGGRLISAVKPIQLAFQQFSRLWKQSNGESAGSAYTSAPFVAFADILGSAEQVAVSVLEGVAQMEMQLEEQVAGEGALAVYGALLDIVPSALKLIAEPSSGDIRVLVSVCLRRLLPSLISAVSSLFPAQVLHVALDHINRRKVQVSSTAMGLAMGVLVCVTETIRWLPHLLSDKAPVPQYAVRLAADLSLTSYPVALIIGHEIEMDFVDCGCGLVTGRGATVMLEHLPRRRPLLIEIISRMLPSVAAAMYCSSSTFADLSEDDDHSSSTDPQAGALIRMLIEKASTSASTEFFSQLQAQGQRGPAGGALVVTATSDSFMATLLSGGLCWALREAIAWAIIQSNMDHLSILLDLLQHYLEHIIARTGSDNDADRSITEFLSQRNTAAEYFAPLAAWMAAVASCISGSCRLRQRASESSSVGRNWSMLSRGFTPDSSTALDPVQDSSVYHVVLDGCVVCLTLLSELSPAHFIKVRFLFFQMQLLGFL